MGGCQAVAQENSRYCLTYLAGGCSKTGVAEPNAATLDFVVVVRVFFLHLTFN